MSGLEIIVGTYEEYTAGYKVEPFKTDPSRHYLKEIFSTHSHTASVRALASHGKYLVSGGADDRICIFDLETGTLKDELLHHNGTINCVTFTHDGSYLFSGSHDGTISAINMKRLAVEKTWKNAHKSAVLSITLHPTDKLALSLGADMNLRTWDLVSGRTIYTRGFRNDPRFGGYLSWVEWGPDGNHFALMGSRVVEVISIETTKSVRAVECTSKPVSLCWISETEIAVGLDDGHLLFFDITKQGKPEKIRAYESRLKAIAFVDNHLATASSSGDISLWKISGNEFHEICTTNIGCRPTCILLVEADRLGLHKYLQRLEDDKCLLKQKLRTIHSVGKVTVEHEDPIQEANENGSKKQKKRPVAEESVDLNTPVAKKKKNDDKFESSICSESKSEKRKKNKLNTSCAGLWEEEENAEGPATENSSKKEKKTHDLNLSSKEFRLQEKAKKKVKRSDSC